MKGKRILIFWAVSAALTLQGCAKSQAELDGYIREIKQRPGGPLPPLPTMKVFPPYEYNAQDLRDPFAKVASEEEEETQVATGTGAGPRPIQDRRKEELESYPLDALDMVGTLGAGAEIAALIKDPTGVIHRVRLENYLGQNDGKILAIYEDRIELEELFPNGLGGYELRQSAIALDDE